MNHKELKELANILGRYSAGDEFQRPIERVVELLEKLAKQEPDGVVKQRDHLLAALKDIADGDVYNADGMRTVARAAMQKGGE